MYYWQFIFPYSYSTFRTFLQKSTHIIHYVINKILCIWEIICSWQDIWYFNSLFLLGFTVKNCFKNQQNIIVSVSDNLLLHNAFLTLFLCFRWNYGLVVHQAIVELLRSVVLLPLGKLIKILFTSDTFYCFEN